MIVEGIDYNKTVETNKIVFKGQTYQKVTTYIYTFIATSFSLGISYSLFKTQIENNPSLLDYFVAIFFPILIMGITVFFSRLLLTRDKLKEFAIQSNTSVARLKIFEAAKKLSWEPCLVTDKYMVFKTKFGIVKNCQTVTLIIFPDNRIYFNSINFPNDYMKAARFEENYQDLKSEYQKIEKTGI